MQVPVTTELCPTAQVTALRAEARCDLKAMVVGLALGLWGTYIRGWRVMRAHRRR